MANTKHFAGTDQLTQISSIDNRLFAKDFPGTKGLRCDSFSRWVGRDASGTLRPVERIIEFKRHPSLHACGPRCLGATGFVCECSCAGANHGAGA